MTSSAQESSPGSSGQSTASLSRAFRALGVMLSYPQPVWLDVLPEVAEEASRNASEFVRQGLDLLAQYLGSRSLTALQETYVSLFDRTRSVSLHLFEHSHGDARERGQAMARLRQLYADQGWELSSNELPDYLPAVCEFCSLAEPELRDALLAEALPILQRLAQRLEEKASPYSAVVARIVEVAGERPFEVRSDDAPTDEPDLDDWEALDRQWEDSPVTFGVGAAHDSCNVAVDLIRPSRLTRRERANPGARRLA